MDALYGGDGFRGRFIPQTHCNVYIQYMCYLYVNYTSINCFQKKEKRSLNKWLFKNKFCPMLNFIEIPLLDSHFFGSNISLPEGRGYSLNSPPGNPWMGLKKWEETSDQQKSLGRAPSTHSMFLCLLNNINIHFSPQRPRSNLLFQENSHSSEILQHCVSPFCPILAS